MATTVLTIAPSLLSAGTVLSTEGIVPSGFSSITLTAQINATDIVNTALTLSVEIQVFDTNANSFLTWAGFTWRGGVALDKFGHPANPTITVDPTSIVGQRARISLTVPLAITVGATVQLN